MKKIVVFSGAGMSAESGIQTFRDSDGLWESHKLEDVATPEAWRRDPDLVSRFYNERRKKIKEVNPNLAHAYTAKLQEIANVNVITQNIDDLHERAGSTKVLHLHGNIMYAKSSGPNQEKEYYKIEEDELELTALDKCSEGFRLRPHVVWFGEEVPNYNKAVPILESADILVIIGTSLQVHPAAGLIGFARAAKTKYIIDPKVNELNLPMDFNRIEAVASVGMKHVYDEIKKALLR